MHGNREAERRNERNVGTRPAARATGINQRHLDQRAPLSIEIAISGLKISDSREKSAVRNEGLPLRQDVPLLNQERSPMPALIIKRDSVCLREGADSRQNEGEEKSDNEGARCRHIEKRRETVSNEKGI